MPSTKRVRAALGALSPKSPKSPSSKHKALLIGINYTSLPDQPGPKRCPSQLKGPVRDVKEMKSVLMEVYDYPEDDIFVMTDEEQHRDTLHWPSETNILQAITNLVDRASAGDAFIFYYAGHSGQQPAEKDTREIDGLDEYILTCDEKVILDDTLRACLVDKLPKDTRLTAILDACHSGTDLDLDHYCCHWSLRRSCQSLTGGEKPVAPSKELAERHTEAERPLCGGRYWAYTVLNGPLVVSVSACSDHESTVEDSQRSGKGMTVKLTEILRKHPSIKLGNLSQQLEKSLYNSAIVSVWKAKKTFKLGTKKLSPEQKELQDKWTAKGVFGFKPQTAQIGSLHSLSLTNGAYQQSLNKKFILKRLDQRPHLL